MEAKLLRTITPDMDGDGLWKDYDDLEDIECIEVYETDTYREVSIAIIPGQEFASVFDNDPRSSNITGKWEDHLFNVLSCQMEDRATIIGAMAVAHWMGRLLGRKEGTAHKLSSIQEALGLNLDKGCGA